MPRADVTRRGARRRRSDRAPRRLWVEAVERRRLLAAVSWDAGGDGINWTDALNWSTDSLPQAADDVTISVGTDPTILIPSGTQSIKSLVTDEAIRTTGGTLAVSTTAQASQSVTIAGGGLSGGAWTFSGGSSVLTTSVGGTLANVSITGGDLLLNVTSARVLVSGTTSFPAARLQASSANFLVAPGYVLNSLIVAEGAATGTRILNLASGAPGTITVGASGVIRLAAGCGGGLTLQNANIATVVNNGLISAEAAGRTLSISNSTFTNNSTGTTQVTAGTLTIDAANWSNPGSMAAASGTAVNLSGAWSNAGSLSITSATLNLGGTFSTSGFNFAGFTRTGGTVNLTGTLNNASNTVTLNAATGSWILSGGTINNGTVDQTGGSVLVTTSTGGTLTNVTLTGADLLLNVASARVLLGGTTSFPAARLQGNSTNLQMAPGYVLNSLVVAEGATTTTHTINLSSGGAGTITVGPTGVIRLAAGCGGNLLLQNANIATLVNNGLISHEAAGRTMNFTNSTFTNNGTTQVTAGTLTVGAANWSNPGSITAGSGTTVNFNGTWSSAGTMNMTSATLNLGGTFSGFNSAGFTRTGGTVNLTGTLNNASSTITLDAVTGSWILAGGTINGGTVAQTGGSVLALTSTGGTLANVTFTGGDLLLNVASARVLVSGTTTFPAARLQANSATVLMAPGYVLNSLVVAEGAAAGTRLISMGSGGPGTITVGPTGVIRLAADCGGNLSLVTVNTVTLVNNGLITAEATGRTLSIQSNTFTHAGTLSASAGTLSVTPGFTNSGSINVSAGASFSTGGSVPNAGQLTTAGRVTVAGLLDIQAGSSVVAQPGGTAVIRVNSLALAANHVFELNDNDLIVDYSGASPVADIEAMIAGGFNGGEWNGPGIVSTSALNDPNFILAVAENALLLQPFGDGGIGDDPLFSGQAVDDTAVLVKFTHRVDLDLDGLITGNDAAVFNAFFNEGQPATWQFGDLDYDGVYSGNDAAIFNGFYNESLDVI